MISCIYFMIIVWQFFLFNIKGLCIFYRKQLLLKVIRFWGMNGMDNWASLQTLSRLDARRNSTYKGKYGYNLHGILITMLSQNRTSTTQMVFLTLMASGSSLPEFPLVQPTVWNLAQLESDDLFTLKKLESKFYQILH